MIPTNSPFFFVPWPGPNFEHFGVDDHHSNGDVHGDCYGDMYIYIFIYSYIYISIYIIIIVYNYIYIYTQILRIPKYGMDDNIT